MIAIGGTGMAPLACLLRGRGHRVRGSDRPLYPPMSTLLEAAGIEPMAGFDAGHLEPRPDLVVVGNAVPRDNPEARQAERLHRSWAVERISMPEALWRFFLADRYRVVVAGTHGKTTTTSLAAWVWSECGADPSYLVGGLPRDLPGSFRDGGGEDFLIEGDEYNAAYFDRGPKFLHYRPDTLILTSAEYDHVDLYPSHGALLEAYRTLVERLPPEGLLVAYGGDPDVREIVGSAECRTVLYGLDPGTVDVAPLDGIELGLETGEAPGGSRFRLSDPFDPQAEPVVIRLRIAGRHNVLNAMAVWIAARGRGLPAGGVASALESFRGVARRLDELGTAAGATVVDDFAHHPTAVAESLAALRHRFPGRRLVALFEPRSLTAARALNQEAYAGALAGADRVLLAPVFHAGRFERDELLDLDRLVADLRAAGVEAEAFGSVAALRRRAVESAEAGDVLVTMSSGSFEQTPHRLLEELERKESA